MVADILPCQEVSDPKLAAVLADPKALRNLYPFMGQDNTLGQAAQSLSVSQHHLRYWVEKFTALGLLQQVRSEARKGRAIKWYRASANRYFVPFRAVATDTLEQLMLQQDAPWNELLARNLVQVGLAHFEQLHTWGLSIFVAGSLCIEIATSADDQQFLHQRLIEPSAPAVVMSWIPMQLNFETAKAFQRELSALLERYSQMRGAQTYLARFALTPLVKE